MANNSYGRFARITAEFVGTAFLLMAVVGSGIMGDRLSGGNVAIALLANTLATGAALVALILTFGPVSGAHLNPAVTLADASQRGVKWNEVPGYLIAQVLGAYVGVACAHLMFGLPLFSASQHSRIGASQTFSEFIATFGLMSVIWGCSRLRSSAVPFAVGAYITAAYWFTASTSFANPAVTLARAATNTFSGIRPADAPGFIAAQLLGAGAATALFRWLVPTLPTVAKDVLVSHGSGDDNPLIEELFHRFREKFGRDPLPTDPLFFDPEADKPIPLKEEARAAMWEQLADKWVREGEISPANAYAMKKTGLFVTESTIPLLSHKQLADWNAAVDEYLHICAEQNTRPISAESDS